MMEVGGPRRVGLVALWALALGGPAGSTTLLSAQQVADTAFAPDTGPAAFPAGQGPGVLLDEAHHNFHTVDGRYTSFARILRADGFVVEAATAPVGELDLTGADVLVIANALHESNAEGAWRLPTPSAFTPGEIEIVRRWVHEGGALFLIADHMPFPGAAKELAAAFGFRLMNGFAVDPANTSAPFVFRTADGTLAGHPVTEVLEVDSVATFTGEAFRPPAEAVSLLTLPEGIVSLNPEVAWQFDEDTPAEDVGGWSQGAIMEVGEGRVAVFGEAAMFSAQLAGPQQVPMGMNAPVASQNPRFLVSLVRWLAGVGKGG